MMEHLRRGKSEAAKRRKNTPPRRWGFVTRAGRGWMWIARRKTCKPQAKPAVGVKTASNPARG